MGNVIVSNITRTPVESGSNWGSVAGTVTPPSGDWQLPTANYQDTITTAELVFPRPDAETPVWAKHRRHYPGIQYQIPIGVAFGSWPYYFEIITAPAGVTIGSFLTVSGDKLIVGDDYGVLTWTSPTAGNHSFSVRVSFQDGTTPLVIDWTLEVTTVGTIFVDATALDDTGTGAIGSPFKTIDGWFKSDNTDRTFTQYQVCYKAGAYSVATTDPASSGTTLRMNWWNKPLVHYAYNSDIVSWDCANTMSFSQSAPANPGGESHGSDWFVGGVSCIGGEQAASGRRWNFNSAASATWPYDGTGSGCRVTWFKSPQKDWTYTGNSANNAGLCFAENTGDIALRRSYWYVSQSPITNVTGAGTNFNGWFVGQVSYFLAEHVDTSGTNFGRGPFSGKSSEYMSCYRNVDMSQDTGQGWNYDNAGSYAPLIGGGTEVSYCKVNNQTSDTAASAIISGHHVDLYSAAAPYSKPNTHFRNNISKAPATAGRAFNAFYDWPVSVYDDMWCSGGDGTYGGAPLNTQLDGQWELYAVASNPFDGNMDLTGTARTSFLGVKGAEVSM